MLGTAITVSEPSGAAVDELSAVRAHRDERDDVDLFAALLERTLEGMAVARRHDQLMTAPAGAGELG